MQKPINYDSATLAAAAILFAESVERELLAIGETDGETCTFDIKEDRLDLLTYQLTELAERARAIQASYVKSCNDIRVVA